MTPFAIIVSWGAQSASAEEVANLLEPIRSRCSDGRTSGVVPGAAVAVGLRAVVPGESLESGLLVDKQRRRLIVGDIRLYGRGALATRFGADVSISDIDLVGRAIDRFGMDAPTHLVGDFAFVVWEWGEQRVWAARDHFGMRSLHYQSFPERIVFATDVRQLLALRSRTAVVEPEIDLDMALNYLLNNRGHGSRTYFRGIAQVRAAHRLTAVDGQIRETSYWSPPRELVVRPRQEDYVDEWRDLFKVAVVDRLASAHPIAAHLSGGLDSGAIVGVAHETYEASAGTRPPLVTLSALFPGLACDETSYIDAAVQRAPMFASERWNACVRDSSELEAPLIPAPGLPRGPRVGPWRDIEVARERGARVLLTGDGGDEVGGVRGIFRDLIRRGRVLTLMKEMADLGSWTRRRQHFADGVRGLFSYAILDLLRGNDWVTGPAPDWLGPDLVKNFPGSPDEDDGNFRFDSHLQRQLWRAFASPRAFAALGLLCVVGGDAGIEVRTPFLDIRLVNYALAIPWAHRLPGGDLRRLERDAIRPFVPEVVANRMKKPEFSGALSNQIRLNFGRIRKMIEGSTWVSSPYVQQSGARRLLRECTARDPEVHNFRAWLSVWKIASFEGWLRGIRAYNAG